MISGPAAAQDCGASVADGPVGTRWLQRFRTFRYEIRRWQGGVVPDLEYAVESPVRLADDLSVVALVLDLAGQVPTPVWGRDELHAGEMWNSNSVISWVLSRAGVLDRAGGPPWNGRAPGWDAGVTVARRTRCRGALQGDVAHRAGPSALLIGAVASVPSSWMASTCRYEERR